MLGYILTVMLLLSVLLGIFNGHTGEISKAITDGAGDAVKLCISMAGMIALWSGIMKIAEKAGIVSKISLVLRPIIRLLFPNVKTNSECENAISLNITANILGLGNAATPMGIKAMRELQKISRDTKPSKEMTIFLVLNCASLQLIPSTVAALRGANGAKSAFDIIPAVWLTSAATLIFALILAKILLFFIEGGKSGH